MRLSSVLKRSSDRVGLGQVSARAAQNTIYQIVLLGCFLALFGLLISNVQVNVEDRNINTGFAFLSDPAGFSIGESAIRVFSTDPYWRVILAGVLNTLKVAVIAIFLSSILGVIIGVSRLSPTWVIARSAAFYVEIFRNIPLLLQLVFWYAILTHALPIHQEAWNPLPGVYISNRGLFLPALSGWLVLPAALLSMVVVNWLVKRIFRKWEISNGRLRERIIGWLASSAAAAAVIFWIGGGLSVDVPYPERFNLTGGLELSAEYLALLLALTLYTAAYIGEIVRAGILSVPKGQKEAASALGLSRWSISRKIVLPQALRVVIPPTTSWHINTIKNSSLAIAIGYPDLVSITDTTINQTGQAIEGVAIIMSVYLTISLSLSAILNWYNRRVSKQALITTGGGFAQLPDQVNWSSWIDVRAWFKRNLFRDRATTFATLGVGLLSAWLLSLIIQWAILGSVVSGGPEDCRAASGACWAFVVEKHRFILFGTYPESALWRPVTSIVLFAVIAVASFYRRLWGPSLLFAWIAVIFGMVFLMFGGLVPGMTFIPTGSWGGLPVTLILASVAIIAGFPLAVLLALGRTSSLPIIRMLCVGYIELIRGVPLISILFMAAILFPLFLPPSITIDNLLRVQIGLTLFTAAYMAEVIRGGLQAVAKGQYDAAAALGLGYWNRMSLVVLPQALRVSFPGMVNTFISEIKNTTLVVIVGVFDILNATKASLTDVEWRPFFIEAYVFTGAIFFVLCFFITRLSKKVEDATQPSSVN